MKKFLSTLKGKIIVSLIGVAVIASIVAAVIIITAPESYRSIKVAEIVGKTIIVNETDNSSNAYEGMNLYSGDKVSVQADSNMTLLFDADKYMFADEGTKFRVEASGDSKKGTTKTRIYLEEGSVLCRLDSKLSDDEVYEVETPNSVMSVRGTIFRMSIYQDDTGENFTRIDVLEGAVKTDLHKEDGTQIEEEETIEAGKSALVHSNPDISEFVVGENEIPFDEYSESMSQFVISTIDDGREIYIDKETFEEKTGLKEEDIEVKPEVKPKDETEPEVTLEDETEEAPKHEHVMSEWQVQTVASCTTEGVEVIKCTECEVVLQARNIAMLDHEYGEYEVTREATCTNSGEETATCKNCDNKITQAISIKAHTFGNWSDTKAATCTENGEQTRTCSACGISETTSIAALGHEYSHTSDCIHQKQSFGPYTVGQGISLNVTMICSRCQAQGDITQTTGTVAKIHADYPDFCEYSCSCGHIGTY